MPDWFYRTVSRPLLFRLPAEASRNFALGLMGLLSRLPLGPAVIDLLGHMRADPRLGCSFAGVSFPTPVGIGPDLDARGDALPALARFGIGFLEVGPVTVAGSAGLPDRRLADRQAISRQGPPATLSLSAALARLGEIRGRGVPTVVRISSAAPTPEQAETEYEHLATRLAGTADLLVLTSLEGTPPGQEHLRRVLRGLADAGRPTPVLLAVGADADRQGVRSLLGAALEVGIAGVVVDACVQNGDGARLRGLPAYALALEQVRQLRRHFPDVLVLASGSVHEPEHALEMLQAGANLVSADTGLVFSGPGLVKRSNEAILYARAPAGPADESPGKDRAPERAWFWTALMGAGMLLGSLMALAIAATRVVLPYDEAFVGMSRADLAAVNPRLLLFLAHDRVSLAGTMVSIGVMYLGLSLFGIRQGMHWAQQAVFWSACTGFGTFFLFLGYGYLDAFHAFVTSVLFQFLLLALHSRLGPAPVPEMPQLVGDWRWRLSLWGQLLLIGHAIAVLVAGVVICTVGVTHVFVHEDLEFMQTTAAALTAANPRLLPLVAHDRATFGGMLVANGLVFLLPVLWGFRPGTAWLWWTQLIAGVLAYSAAIAVHLVVGYTNLWHLTPAFGGLAVFLLGEALAFPFLCRPGGAEADWARYRFAGVAGAAARPGTARR